MIAINNKVTTFFSYCVSKWRWNFASSLHNWQTIKKKCVNLWHIVVMFAEQSVKTGWMPIVWKWKIEAT